ncbi:MAG TPA: bifunctional DedA family/phosphatase PAP2 family protein [Gemmatimonadaceae bacterium]|nr:bifunctional DedA family/phosphatase PAP2 family protein [Gemmatimonadaceae bacterium]
MIDPASLAGWVAHYGYAALALGVFAESAGVPLPGGTLLITAGALAGRGQLSLVTVVLVATTAGILGDNLGFALGRTLGRGWLDRHGRWVLLTPSRLTRVDAFLARFGAAAVAIARFVAGARVIMAFTAGASRMRWRTFLPLNVLGAAAWATVTALLGAAVGLGYSALSGAAGRTGVVVVLAGAALGAGIWMMRGRLRADEGEVTAGARLARLPAALGAHTIAALAVGMSAAWAFIAIAEEVNERDTAPLDFAVRGWTLAHHAPELDVVFRMATWAGSTLCVVPLATVVAWWLWRRRGRAVAAVTMIAPVVASLAIIVSKLAFHRARPEGALGLGLGYSFPSGHSTESTAIACVLVYVLVREYLIPRSAILFAVLFPIVVGLSRVYLDVHWATDVIGGWSIGVGIAMVTVVLYERVRVPDPGGRRVNTPA